MIRGGVVTSVRDACPAISTFTRVRSPSKTGVNALNDALWRKKEQTKGAACTLSRTSGLYFIGQSLACESA
jgi:hypothetical protein